MTSMEVVAAQVRGLLGMVHVSAAAANPRTPKRASKESKPVGDGAKKAREEVAARGPGDWRHLGTPASEQVIAVSS